MEQVENYVVSNARIVQTDNQLWDMPDRYKAQYCIAKANRFILVKCLACGCGMYGKYGYKDPEDQKETIRVLAAFVNRKLEASAAHL
jgi:hypothetical protein